MSMFPFNDLTDYQFKHLDEQLFLPDEILGMIALSKPVFRYYEEYNAYVRVFGKECPSLKKRLHEPNVEPVLKAMNEYLKASALYNNASNEHDILLYILPFKTTPFNDWTVEEKNLAKSSARSSLNKCDYLYSRVLASSRDLNRLISSV